jgi:hypothetical protein
MCTYDGNLQKWLRAVREVLPGDDRMPVRLAAYAANSDHDAVEDMLDAVTDLSDLLEQHLDTFGSTSTQVTGELDHRAIRDVCRTFRPVLVAALLIESTRQISVPRKPRSTYVGQLAIDLVADVTGKPQHQFLHTVFERARKLEPELWQAFGTMLGELESRTCNWTCWPSSEIAQQISVQLSEIGPSWGEARESERLAWRGGQRREQRRDPAFRRAQQWHGMLVRIFGCLASARGDLRLGLEYGLGVLNHCCNMGPGIEDDPASTAELAVLEVFTSVDRVVGCSPTRLEIGDACRRKRVQRARLRVVTHWPESIDSEQWQADLLPQLGEFASRAEHTA